MTDSAGHALSVGTLPRELVLASAGSGKTYRLSSRIIGLLAAGTPAREVLASTFTRKAAGEILERVLVRLAEGALNPDRARELGRDAHARLVRPEECRQLLGVLLTDLHYMNVGTLDAFLIRVARSFFQELGLAPGWKIADKSTEALLRTESVQTALAKADRAELVELLRMLNRGDTNRQVHASLLDKVDDLLRLRRQLDPESRDPWTPDFGSLEVLSEEEVRRQAADLADRLRALEVPLTKVGSPMKSWVQARDDGADSVEGLAWVSVFGKGLGAKVISGDGAFQNRPIDSTFGDIFLEARALARRDLGPKLQRETQALGRLADLLADAFEHAQQRSGAYRFEDITYLLGGPDPTGGRVDLHYRLDQQIRHLLLDEFQDTSLEQWTALEPLAHELLSGHIDERAGVIVADTKQSIYGWRGARPELVRQVGKAHGLKESTMTTSWRSSQVVLDFVDSVFRDLPTNKVITEIDVGPAVASAWMQDFTELRPARDLPGHVQVHLGPGDDGQGAVRPKLLRHAAAIVKALHQEMPGKTIGVLARRNSVIGRIMDELRALGVRASGEGGTSLTDTAPVNAILSLLRLADHPGDSASRYHVAMTPLGEVVGLTDRSNSAGARIAASRVRERLLANGYGPTLATWVRELAPRSDAREVERLLQLVELGHRWDERATLRPADFARYVAEESVEDPSSALVKVMTVHRSKGLEFDAVVLPELYAPLSPKGGGVAIPERGANGRVSQVYPNVSKDLRRLFPEVDTPLAEMREAEMRDALSVLYVALTRAKYALHVVLPPEGGTARHSAGVIRAALGISDRDLSLGTPGTSKLVAGLQAGDTGVLREWGDPNWYDRIAVERAGAVEDGRAGVPVAAPKADLSHGTALLRSGMRGAGRNLARRSPSSLEGGPGVELAFVLRLDQARALQRGTVVHAWCERIVWIEAGLPDDGLPDDDALTAVARSVSPAMTTEQVRGLVVDFRSWMEAETIRTALGRNSYPSGADVMVRVENELPFARRVKGEIQEGFIDRLVLVERGGRIVAADILDFKTDRIEAGDEEGLSARTQYYRPQIEAYCQVVREQHGLAEDEVTGKLLFLRSGEVRPVV
jgi:ATP-dependent helicase/nuclease subunit A